MPRRALENISQLQVIRDFILPKHFFATSKTSVKQRKSIIKKVGKTGAFYPKSTESNDSLTLNRNYKEKCTRDRWPKTKKAAKITVSESEEE